MITKYSGYVFKNGHSDTHLMRLKTLEKQCGPLCNLEKPILGGKESFIGKVEAKVIGGQLIKYSLARGKHGVWNWLHGFVNKPTMLGQKLKSWNSDLRIITNPQGGLLNLIQFGRSGTSASARYFPSLLYCNTLFEFHRESSTEAAGSSWFPSFPLHPQRPGERTRINEKNCIWWPAENLICFS